MSPALVLSLDFELRWGVHDVLGASVDAYRSHLEGVRDVVPLLLEGMRARGLCATWATVGALLCESWDEYFDRAPSPPAYLDPGLCFDAGWKDRDPTGRLHFAPDLVKAIAEAPGQELGHHTFSHIFLGEPGAARKDARADHEAVVRIFADKLGARPKSLVYPRNQVAFVDEYRADGEIIYRATEGFWPLSAVKGRDQLLATRVARFAESLVSGVARPRSSTPGETRSSAFVRLGLGKVAAKLHARKLQSLARSVERSGGTLHLWLHPHNLGDAPKRRVTELLDLMDACRDAAPSLRPTRMSELPTA